MTIQAKKNCKLNASNQPMTPLLKNNCNQNWFKKKERWGDGRGNRMEGPGCCWRQGFSQGSTPLSRGTGKWPIHTSKKGCWFRKRYWLRKNLLNEKRHEMIFEHFSKPRRQTRGGWPSAEVKKSFWKWKAVGSGKKYICTFLMNNGGYWKWNKWWLNGQRSERQIWCMIYGGVSIRYFPGKII